MTHSPDHSHRSELQIINLAALLKSFLQHFAAVVNSPHSSKHTLLIAVLYVNSFHLILMMVRYSGSLESEPLCDQVALRCTWLPVKGTCHAARHCWVKAPRRHCMIWCLSRLHCTLPVSFTFTLVTHDTCWCMCVACDTYAYCWTV